MRNTSSDAGNDRSRTGNSIVLYEQSKVGVTRISSIVEEVNDAADTGSVVPGNTHDHGDGTANSQG